MTEAKVLTADEVGAMSDSDRKKALTSERAAVTRATKAEKPAPPTPVQDWLAANETSEGKAPKVKKEAKPTIPGPERGADPANGAVRFLVDGRRIGVTQHSLSYIAGYTGRGEQRWSVKRLEKALEDAGITDPMNSAWTFELPCASGPRMVVAQLIPGRTLANGAVVGANGRPGPVPKAPKAEPVAKKAAGTKKAAPAAA